MAVRGEREDERRNLVDGDDGGMERPSRPPRELLRVAAHEVAQRHGSVTPHWEVVARWERPMSTVFELRASTHDGAVRSFCKVDFLDPKVRPNAPLAQRRQARRLSLEVESRLGGRLRSAFSVSEHAFDDPLAIDVADLAGVRCAVDGRSLDRRWSQLSLDPATSSSIGDALSIVELVGQELGRSLSLQGLCDEIGALSEGLAGHRDELRVRDKVGQLLGSVDALGKDAFAWCHGDVSPSNILTLDGRIGLIDFSWRERLVGSDVAHLLARVASASPVPGPVLRRVGPPLIDGYLQRRPELQPAVQLALVLRSLTWLQSSVSRRQSVGNALLSLTLAGSLTSH